MRNSIYRLLAFLFLLLSLTGCAKTPKPYYIPPEESVSSDTEMRLVESVPYALLIGKDVGHPITGASAAAALTISTQTIPTVHRVITVRLSTREPARPVTELSKPITPSNIRADIWYAQHADMKNRMSCWMRRIN